MIISVYGRVRRLSETHLAIYKSHGRESEQMDWDQIPIVLVKSVIELQDKVPATKPAKATKPKRKSKQDEPAN